jgi:hypothetical protein
MAIKHYQSVGELTRTESFELQVARGLIAGHSLVNIFGHQQSIGTTSICVWENPTAYVFPASAVPMTMVSTSAADVGVTKLISGLDADYKPISESIVLNGTTPVITTNSYLRINNVRTTAGNAVGTATFVNGGITYAKILAGLGQTQMAQYTVPAGHTFYLTRVDVFSQLSGGSGNYCTYDVRAQLPNGVIYSILQSPFTQRYEARRVVPFPYAEKTSLQWHANSNSSTAAVGVVIEGILVKNDEA